MMVVGGGGGDGVGVGHDLNCIVALLLFYFLALEQKIMTM